MMFVIGIMLTVYFWAEHEGFKGRQGDRVRDMRKMRGGGGDV